MKKNVCLVMPPFPMGVDGCSWMCAISRICNTKVEENSYELPSFLFNGQIFHYKV